MDNNIIIKVEYEKPKTDAFAMLMDRYNAAAELATSATEHYRPLAEAAEQAKFTAILDQLETIKGYLLKLHEINPDITQIKTYSPVERDPKCLELKINKSNTIEIYWAEWYPLTMEHYQRESWPFTDERCGCLNILGNWDRWGMYKRIEKACFDRLRWEINRKEEAAKKEKKRLENITGGQEEA